MNYSKVVDSHDKARQSYDMLVQALNKRDIKGNNFGGSNDQINLNKVMQKHFKDYDGSPLVDTISKLHTHLVNTQVLIKSMDTKKIELAGEIYEDNKKSLNNIWQVWINFVHKLARWVIACFAALFLYSCANYLTDSACKDDDQNKKFCWVMPIKDWIPGHD